MKKFSRIISLVLCTGMATSSMQMVGMERVRRGWQSFTEAVSPSQKIQSFKNALSCVWSNNCTPQDMRNIKWGLAGITALIVGGALLSRALPPGEVTVAQLMDRYAFHSESKATNFLRELVSYIPQERQDASIFQKIQKIIDESTKDDFAMLRAAKELLSRMSVDSKTTKYKRDDVLTKIKAKIIKIS